MLRILQASHGTLPFSLADDLSHGEERWHDYTNPLVRPVFEYGQFLVSATADCDFGPLGTVGLHIKSCATFNLPSTLDAEDAPTALLLPGSLPHSFLFDGLCPEGTRFRVRMTDPTDFAAIHVPDSPLDRMVELVINDIYSIRFERRHPSPTRHYTAKCTRAFWPGCDPDDRTEIVVAEFDLDEGGFPTNVRGHSDAAPSGHQVWFCRVGAARLRELVAKVVSTVRWIGAIRSTQRRASVRRRDFKDPRIAEGRYVGGEGRYAHVLARRFAYNEIAPAVPPSQGSINYFFSRVEPEACKKLLAARDSTSRSPARRIWDSACEQSRDEMSRIEVSAGQDVGVRAARVLNDALRRRDLFDPEYWSDESHDLLPFLHKLLSSNEILLKARELASGLDTSSGEFWQKLLSYFPENEITAINRGLIESALGMRREHPGLVFQTYYSVWLKRLLDIEQVDDDGACLADDWCGEQPPCGYLLKYTPDKARSDRYSDSGDIVKDSSGEDRWVRNSEYQRDLARLNGPSFATFPAAPIHMSSGFHQVAPIIIQAGLMMKHEILCIENPEVHLHPKLQLDIAEFLVRQAAIGKYMVVETHSDLVLRRVMRAVLEEELSQEAVRLYFARMDTKSEPHRGRQIASSVLESIEIDEGGRIRNWPKGFMDDDVRESRRLLDIMYGAIPEGEEEGEDRGSNDT
jgi:hypothetical protein